MSKRFIITLVLIFIVLFGVFAASYTPEVDELSTYKPTQIINGNFDLPPWMKFTWNGTTYDSWTSNIDSKGNEPSNRIAATNIVFNGVDKGWNTTEKYPWNGSLFEYSDSNHQHIRNNNIDPKSGYVEMNCYTAAVLYQDLTTVGGDVIKWTLNHATTNSTSAEEVQDMHVEIGAPEMSGTTIVNAEGVDSKIDTASKASYYSNGVTNPTGTILGFAGSDIGNLSLNQKTQNDGWTTATGIYLVPDNQAVTRFAFISDDSTTPNFGNLLDNITFSTLIGNLSAVQNTNKSITISGYWGDSDANKKLYIKFNTDSQPTAIDMSGVLNKNFTITIPKDNIPKGAISIEVYHQDYASAKRTIEIIPSYNVLMYVGKDNKLRNPDTARDLDLGPSIEAIKTLYEATTSTNTGKVKISAFYTEEQDCLVNGTDLINKYSLIFVCFPNDFGTDTQTVADNLINYTKQGGCLVMIGEEVGGGSACWYAGNVVLTTLADKMGIDISYGKNAPVNYGDKITVNTKTSLTNVEGSMVYTLESCAIPELIIGQGSNTKNNTTIVGTMYDKDTAKNEPVITDTKVENGYITFLTDINIWMGWTGDWQSVPQWPEDSKNFMRNLLRRSVDNIEAVSNMNKITYAGLENSHYASDGGKNTLTNPSAYSSTDTFTLNNPIKEGYEFVGWTGTDISGLTKTVTIAKGSTGDRTYTANWHKHEWVYTTKGSALLAYCAANNLNSNLCSYHDEEHAVSLFMQAQWNAGLAATIQPSNATNKNVIWSSSNTSVLTVDQKGFIHGIKAGEATVTATSTDGSNKTATCTVTVQGK